MMRATMLPVMLTLSILPLLTTLASAEEAVIVPPYVQVTGVVVDTDGKPVAGALVQDADGMVPAKMTDASGRFDFSSYGIRTVSLTLVAQNESGTLLGYENIGDPVFAPEKKEYRLVLKPTTLMQVKVLGPRDVPVSDAHVWVEHQGYLSCGRTSSRGVAQLRVPAEVPVWYVFAAKGDVGFNYHENFSPGKKYIAADPTPGELTLRLNGARKLQIKAQDYRGRPISGVRFCPWYLKIFGKQDDINISAGNPLRDLNRTTDEQGIATFDWLPLDGTGTMPVLESGYDVYHQPRQVNFDFGDSAKSDTPVLPTRVLRRVPLRGQVVMPDGVTPARGIRIHAEGRGATPHYFREYTRTDAGGFFGFMAYPEQHYIISVEDKDWAAQSITGLHILESETPPKLQLQLVKGTLLKFEISEGAARRPMETSVVVTQVGKDIPDQPGRAESEPYSEREELVRWPDMLRPGEYSIRVGPGLYEIDIEGALDFEPEVLEVKEEEVSRKVYHVNP